MQKPPEAAAGRPSPDEIAKLQAICPVSRETVDRLVRYRELLVDWQAKTNLVAPGTMASFWTRHVADSLQCLSIFPDARNWVDLGSGGGFPGMAIAIANAGDATRSHHLIESIHKKCAFLRMVARETGARAKVHCDRIESVAERLLAAAGPPQVVTARALAPLPALLGLAFPFLEAGAVALLHKGRDFRTELGECDGLWRFDLVVHDSRVEAGSVLLEISNLRRDAQ